MVPNRLRNPCVPDRQLAAGVEQAIPVPSQACAAREPTPNAQTRKSGGKPQTLTAVSNRALPRTGTGTSVAPWPDLVKSIRKTHIDRDHLHPIQRATLRRILHCLTPHWRHVLLVLACIIAGAVLNLASPWFIKRIIDVAIPGRSPWLLAVYCGGMVIGPLVAGL